MSVLVCNAGSITFDSAYVANSNFVLRWASDGSVVSLPRCSGTWVEVGGLEYFDPTLIDPALIASAFGAGVSLVGISYLIGWGFSQVLKAINWR